MTTVIAIDALDREGTFEGYLHDDAGVSFFLVNLPPGGGPALHRHAYAEVFLILEGHACFTAGNETLDVPGGHIVVVPAGAPHKFVNDGSGDLRMVNIHATGKIETEWLEE
ncbi:MAG: cupin domain-containing protein [Chloroflexi bacterium]|nr:cupin domain-containing protein [Chloroflexota bacterium]